MVGVSDCSKSERGTWMLLLTLLIKAFSSCCFSFNHRMRWPRHCGPRKPSSYSFSDKIEALSYLSWVMSCSMDASPVSSWYCLRLRLTSSSVWASTCSNSAKRAFLACCMIVVIAWSCNLAVWMSCPYISPNVLSFLVLVQGAEWYYQYSLQLHPSPGRHWSTEADCPRHGGRLSAPQCKKDTMASNTLLYRTNITVFAEIGDYLMLVVEAWRLPPVSHLSTITVMAHIIPKIIQSSLRNPFDHSSSDGFGWLALPREIMFSLDDWWWILWFQGRIYPFDPSPLI